MAKNKKIKITKKLSCVSLAAASAALLFAGAGVFAQAEGEKSTGGGNVPVMKTKKQEQQYLCTQILDHQNNIQCITKNSAGSPYRITNNAEFALADDGTQEYDYDYAQAITYAGTSVPTEVRKEKGLDESSSYWNLYYVPNKNEDAEFRQKLTQVMNSLNLRGSDVRKFLAIYDYVVEHVRYDNNCGKIYTKQYAYAQSAYNALCKGKAVCVGYALLINEMCRAAGIPCRVINGQAWGEDGKKEDHAWNIVKINGKWYNCDATWDRDNRDTGDYDWFLQGNGFFIMHKRDPEYDTKAFNKKFPMGKGYISAFGIRGREEAQTRRRIVGVETSAGWFPR